MLIELYQEFFDGFICKRDCFLLEKMKFDEDIEFVVKWVVKEELGFVFFKFNDGKGVDFDEIVKIVFNLYDRRVEERVLLLYSGLFVCYVLYIVDVFVEGLLEDEFVIEEEMEYVDCDQGVFEEVVVVRRYFWKWVYVNLV